MHALSFYLVLVAFWPCFVTCQFHCRTPTNIALVHDAVAEQAQYGAADELDSGLREPWPLMNYRNQALRVIKFCYDDQQTRNKFHCSRFKPALNVWMDQLGGVPAAQSGHGLAFLEAGFGHADPSQNGPEFCAGANGEWNPLVEPGTLWIFESNEDPYGGSSSIGYDVLDTSQYRHTMKLGEKVLVSTVVHELGHVFGMAHEAQRSDRDDHVLYQCKNVKGYPEALATAMETGLSEQDAHTKLCEDQVLAEEHNFDGAEFVKNPEGRARNEGEFDLQSIMLYETGLFGRPECDSDISMCPLVQYRKENGRIKGLERISRNDVPSKGDVAWVKKWYPWVGGGSKVT